jgi:hypothetical protein
VSYYWTFQFDFGQHGRARYDETMNASIEIRRLRDSANYAESWTQTADAYGHELGSRTPEQVAAAIATIRAKVESYVGFGIAVGNILDMHWRLTFSNLFDVGEVCISPSELQQIRQEVRRLFLSVRESMDKTRYVADVFHAATGQTVSGADRLIALIVDAKKLEEQVFRDWPSFSEPTPPFSLADCLPPDEALAEGLGITVDEARQKLSARLREQKS